MEARSLPVGPGHVLAGKLRVERVIGSGAMGYILAARHLQLDQLGHAPPRAWSNVLSAILRP